MTNHAAKHPYHLVNPSPWPAVGALAALCLTYGLVRFMHEQGNLLLIIGVALMLFTMAGWWRDVIREAQQGDHTPVVQIGLRYGMALFIASEVMFFAAWFWAYFDASLYPGGPNSAELITRTQVLGGTWPPVALKDKIFDPWGVPFLNTIILLSSGVTVTWAHHALRENNRQQLLLGLLVTILLGATFTSLQAHEYANSLFGFKEGIYASTFFMATGFHGAHVIIGTIFLTVCLVRAYLGHFKPDHHFGFEAAAWYWHFVDVVWLFLFTFVYWRPFF
jgi:cytochrome c oxidase subunit 3